jgi:hypothetical protein
MGSTQAEENMTLFKVMIDSLTKKGMCYSSVVQDTKERVNNRLEGSIQSPTEVVSSV